MNCVDCGYKLGDGEQNGKRLCWNCMEYTTTIEVFGK